MCSVFILQEAAAGTKVLENNMKGVKTVLFSHRVVTVTCKNYCFKAFPLNRGRKFKLLGHLLLCVFSS